jgi:hypothetical protein
VVLIPIDFSWSDSGPPSPCFRTSLSTFGLFYPEQGGADYSEILMTTYHATGRNIAECECSVDSRAVKRRVCV